MIYKTQNNFDFAILQSPLTPEDTTIDIGDKIIETPTIAILHGKNFSGDFFTIDGIDSSYYKGYLNIKAELVIFTSQNEITRNEHVSKRKSYEEGDLVLFNGYTTQYYNSVISEIEKLERFINLEVAT